MKKLSSLVLALFVALMAIPAFADSNTGEEQIRNVKVGSHNVTTAWVDVMDTTHAEASKGKNEAEQGIGLVAGSAIGARQVIHRMGGGVIDILTFWIPKKQPLVNPEKARLA